MDNAPKLNPTVLVIFGITGDLAKHKILPALYHLVKYNLLPEKVRVVGTSRRQIDPSEILNTVDLCVYEKDGICDPGVVKRIGEILSMFKLDPLNDQDYSYFKDYLDQLEEEEGTCLDRLYYLSIPPQAYRPIIEKLGAHGLNGSCQHNNATTKLLVEKPFGYDIESAKQLIENTDKVFSESQIYRIDHYLAKETAQNILKFRRHNPVFSSQWNSRHISRIHVIAREQIGIEGRVRFYEGIGALRDLAQSHLLQLLSLTAMDMPDALTSSEIHAKKHEFMSNLTMPTVEPSGIPQVIRGQYSSYKREVDNPNSNIETFVSLNLKSKDPNWAEAEFRLTTGKALNEKLTAILVYFGSKDPNILRFRIQPDEGIDVDLLIEKPGFTHNLRKVKMNFSYNSYFEDNNHDAYERVLVDAIRGDHLLFATKEEIMASWYLLQPILNYWQSTSDDLVIYENGGKGPSTSRLSREDSAKLKT